MKGTWIPNLIFRVLDGSLTPKESYSILRWRFIRKSPTLSVEGLRYEKVDSVVWRLITDIYVNNEYAPPGFVIKQDDVVIDIGAHRGVFSGFASNRTCEKIVALEPDPINYEVLSEFAKVNNLDQLDIRNYAVTDVTGEAIMYKAQKSSRHSISGVDQVTGNTLEDQLLVRSISLDDLLEPYAEIDFLKMDCEGAEHNILLNASDETLRKVKQMVFEVHWTGNRNKLEILINRLNELFPEIKFKMKSEGLGIISVR